jgi:HK97 family phage major capsid protein
MQTYSTSSKMITLPQELIQDSSVDVVAFVAQRAGERIGRSQNAKFTTGTGTGEPTGIVTAAGIGKTGLAGQTLTIIFDDLVDLVESLDAGHLSLEFMLSQATRKVIRKIKDANSRPVWIPEFEETGASLGGSLLGYGAWVNNDMPVPAANAKSLLFGNFQKYRIRDVSEITISRFDDSAFALKNQVGFIGRVRSGANLLDVSAVKAYAHSAT